MRDASGCTSIRPGHATRIQKKDSFTSFVTLHMGMSVKNHVYVFRDAVWWNVDEPKAETVSGEIGIEWPFDISIAVSANNGQRRADILQSLDNTQRADIPEMPNLIDSFGESFDAGRQVIMRIRQDKDAKRRRHV